MATVSPHGRTIKLFLADGTASGVLTAEIMNWTGKAIVAPRSQLEKLAQRSDASRTGVYFLVGDDPEIPSRERVYIGESENVFERLIQQQKDAKKDFWTKTILVTSKDENLTKSHTLYLESRLIAMAKLAGRAVLDNGTGPTKSLPEPDIADMEFFLTQVQLLLPALSFNFLQPTPTLANAKQSGEDVSPEFILELVGCLAFAREIDGEFIVSKGSTARRESTESFELGHLRDQLIQEGTLSISQEKPEFYVFTMDTPFTSPSTAAKIVCAGSRNGRTAWKVRDTGQTYAEWQSSKLNMVSTPSTES